MAMAKDQPVLGLRLCCYYCGEEMVPARKMNIFRAYGAWTHIRSGKLSCPIRDHVLLLAEQIQDARNIEFERRFRQRTEPWPVLPTRGDTDGDEFWETF